MASVVVRPHPALAGYLGPYIGYRDVLDARAVHHGLPSPTITVILAFEEPIDTAWVDDDAARIAAWTLLGGLHLRPALIRTHGYQHGIQLSLTPQGARTLLGVPSAAVAGQMVAADDLPSGLTADLHPRLADAPDWRSRFTVLESWLLRRLAAIPERQQARIRPDLAEAWRLFGATHGTIRVGDVAARLERSERWLSGAFTAEYGVTPKQASRLHRFDHARALARHGHSLAVSASLAGYADQAHLSRDWRELAGQSPTEVLGKPFRIVQDQAGEQQPR